MDKANAKKRRLLFNVVHTLEYSKRKVTLFGKNPSLSLTLNFKMSLFHKRNYQSERNAK